MNTINNVFGQTQMHDTKAVYMNTSQNAVAAEHGVSVSTEDRVNLTFNPAAISPQDIENAHNQLNPDRVAKLLGLVD